MIEAHNLTRRFGTFPAVSHLSLRVPAGSVLALVGPNGCGKTTTVRMLAGLLAPSEGELHIAGYNIRREPDLVRMNIGLVTDVPGLYEQMKVSAYLDFFGSLYGIPAKERKTRIEELLSFFELTTSRTKKMVGFSKGMKQKVALARALIHQPRVLFLDEPTSGLDPLTIRNVHTLITNLKHTNRSVILCTHDLDEVEQLADEVIMMRQGQTVAHDTPAQLREHASGETHVHVEFTRPYPLTLESLQRLPDLKNVRVVRSSQLTAETEILALEYTTTQPASVNPQVVTQLTMEGAQIVSLTNEHTTLAEVYASLMENKLAPAIEQKR